MPTGVRSNQTSTCPPPKAFASHRRGPFTCDHNLTELQRNSPANGAASDCRAWFKPRPKCAAKSAHCERLFYRKRSLGLHVADHGPHNVFAGRVVRFDDHAEASFAYMNNTVWRRRLVLPSRNIQHAGVFTSVRLENREVDTDITLRVGGATTGEQDNRGYGLSTLSSVSARNRWRFGFLPVIVKPLHIMSLKKHRPEVALALPPRLIRQLVRSRPPLRFCGDCRKQYDDQGEVTCSLHDSSGGITPWYSVGYMALLGVRALWCRSTT